MIVKANTHDSGPRLARYITRGKEGELAELWELRGFALRDITDAFRSVHVMSAIGQCRKPFFHVQIRNREGETLSRVQWNTAIDTIETVMGLVDQPRAVAAHTDLKTGHEHIHVAFSRIDPDTLRARPLPFFKLRLKQASRQLEVLFGLSAVPNERRDRIAYAPKRSEEQQSRRLGVQIHDVREAIKTCFENSDCGRRFQSALDARGLLLAKGDRRDFLVIDRAGGMHALGKRILGFSAAEIRDRLSDLAPGLLPSLEQAREFIAIFRRVSPDNRVDDLEHHANDSSKPRGDDKQAHVGALRKKARAAGKEQRWDQVTQQPTFTRPDFSIDHLVAEQPVQRGLMEGNTAPIDQLRHEALAPTSATAQDAVGVRALTDMLEQVGEPFSCDETAGPEPETNASPPFEQPPPVPKPADYAVRLRQQFRTFVKHLTARVMEPRPARRKRRREEIGGCFRIAAMGLLRRIGMVPLLHFLDPTWEPFTWLHIWEYNFRASTDFHHDCSVPLPPEDPSLRL